MGTKGKPRPKPKPRPRPPSGMITLGLKGSMIFACLLAFFGCVGAHTYMEMKDSQGHIHKVDNQSIINPVTPNVNKTVSYECIPKEHAQYIPAAPHASGDMKCWQNHNSTTESNSGVEQVAVPLAVGLGLSHSGSNISNNSSSSASSVGGRRGW